MTESTLLVIASVANFFVGNPLAGILLFALFVLAVTDEVGNK